MAIFFATVDVRRIQKHVVGNQRLARANCGDSRRRMHTRLAKIGLARRIDRNLFANSLELAAPNILKILPFGRRRRGFVKVDRE